MPIVPAKTWVDNDPLLASELNTYVSGPLTSLMNPPSCKVYRSTALSIAASTLTEVPWPSELWDTASMHSTSSNTGRITVPQAGLYLVTWAMRMGPFTSLTNNYGSVRAYQNGGMVDESLFILYNGMGSNYFEGTGATVLKAAVNDYFQLYVYHNSGAAANIDTGFAPTLSATWIGNG